MVHQDCRLSERRFDFHDMRVSGEKTALVQIATLRALDPRGGYSVGAPGGLRRGFHVALDYERNFSPHRPLADRIRHTNLEAVEPLARIGVRKGNAAAQRWRAAGRCGKAFQGASGGADAAGSHQGNGNIDQDRKADAADRWHRAAARNAVLFAD